MPGFPSEQGDVQILEHCVPDDIPAWVTESESPVVLRQLVSSWPAVKACSQSVQSARNYLLPLWSQKPVTVYVGDESINGRFFYNDEFNGFNFRSGSAKLSEVFDRLSEEDRAKDISAIYIGSTPVDEWLPGFRQQNSVALPTDDALISFWMGSATTISAHFDFPDNLLCVVAGRRRVTLFPPEQLENLYVGPIDNTPSGQAISLVDFDNPDLERFPKFDQAMKSATVLELEPGDALFIPSMWWHHIKALSPFNLMVNHWWSSKPNSFGSPTVALLTGILSLRDLPPRQKEIWRKLFDHYVFDNSPELTAHIPEAGQGCLKELDDNSAQKLRANILQRLGPT